MDVLDDKALRKVQSVLELESQLHKEVLDEVHRGTAVSSVQPRVGVICRILPSASTSW